MTSQAMVHSSTAATLIVLHSPVRTTLLRSTVSPCNKLYPSGGTLMSQPQPRTTATSPVCTTPPSRTPATHPAVKTRGADESFSRVYNWPAAQRSSFASSAVDICAVLYASF
eukprot:m.358645 g.358645  ORF g.358645 m.358645 type:complete len:112 (+) comp18216_c0_seq1:1129-1464(+)